MAEAGRRVAIALLLGVGITFGLLWLMQALVGGQEDGWTASRARPPELHRLRRESPPPPRETRPPERETPARRPAMPEIDVSMPPSAEDPTRAFLPLFDASSEIRRAGTLGARHNASAGPVVRVDPEYPLHAMQRGIEGWVEVEFAITPIGTVEDAKILRAKPQGVFEQTALSAIRRWRFAPQPVDSEPYRRTSRTRFRFELPPG